VEIDIWIFLFSEVDMKEYFSHDYKARSDRKMVNLQMKLNMEGVGCFWSIVEMLYEEGGYLRMEYERIAFELRTDKNVIQQVVEDFELFKNDSKVFWSESVLGRLKVRDDKSVKARESVKVRWDKYERNTNAIQPKDDRNTIKEIKVNEIKEKENNNSHLILPFKELKTEILGSEQWIEQTAMHFRITKAKCQEWLNQFLVEIELKDDCHKPIQEIRGYFINWYKRQPKEPGAVYAAPEKEHPVIFPNKWDHNFYLTLTPEQEEGYSQHLMSLGFRPEYNKTEQRIKFIKS